MKEKVWDIFNNWGPAILALLIPSGAIFTSGVIFNWNVYVVIIVLVIVLIVIVLLFFFFGNNIKAAYCQWKYGRIKGLWSGKNLDKEIYKCFSNSNSIRIKVTRGTDLFDINNNNNIIKELHMLRENASAINPITMQVLLTAPCYKIKHVSERFEYHRNQYNNSIQSFLNSWVKTIEELSDYQTRYFTISVRLYSGEHSRWRFYICSGRKDEKQIILLNNYDKHISGPDTPMYKIIKNEKNIGAFMDRYFDEIWENSIKISDYINYVQDGKCTRLFCEECKNTRNISRQFCGPNCPAASCNLHDECKKRLEEWNSLCNRISELARINLNRD